MTKRKHMSVATQRDAALHALGLYGFELEYDHMPPLGLRERILDNQGNIIGYIPDENDPRYIVPMIKEAHRRKTNGKPHDASSGDIHKVAKGRRLHKKHEEFRRRLLSKGSEQIEERPKKRQWPSRKFGTRPKGEAHGHEQEIEKDNAAY